MTQTIGILAPMPNELRPVVKAMALRRDGHLGGAPESVADIGVRFR